MTIAHADIRELPTATVETLIAAVERADLSAVSDLVRECVGASLSGAAAPPADAWLLAHCTDGVTWGRVLGGALLLSSGKHPKWPTPLPTAENLLQLRIFGDAAEVLVWQAEGEPFPFAGRIATDHPVPGGDDPLAPRKEVYLLAATEAVPHGQCPDDFTVVRDRSGRAQIVPMLLDASDFEGRRHALGLDVRHYFEQDPSSGCVRIAASRLVALRRLGPGDAVLKIEEEA